MGIVANNYGSVSGTNAVVEVGTSSELSRHVVDVTYLNSTGVPQTEDSLAGTVTIEGTVDGTNWSALTLGDKPAQDIAINTANLSQANAMGLINAIRVSAKGLPASVSKIKVTVGSYI